tara:strand:+ start:288 stop:587 length:300 start_codon:yes stop_codon:yes gene_type:complete
MSSREIYDAMDGIDRTKSDKYVQQVKEKFEKRSQVGIKKYNTTLERDDLNFLDWLTHLQEELMDATLYVERLKTSYAEENTKNSTRSKRELYKTIPKEQ